MKKKIVKQISRTILQHKVEFRCYNTITENILRNVIYLFGSYRSQKHLERAIQLRLPDQITLLEILNVETTSNIYIMSEEEFVKHARKKEIKQ